MRQHSKTQPTPFHDHFIRHCCCIVEISGNLKSVNAGGKMASSNLNLQPMKYVLNPGVKPEPERLPATRQEQQLGRELDGKLTNYSLRFLGRTHEHGECFAIWVAVNNGEHPKLEAVIFVNVEKRSAYVKNTEDDNLFWAKLSDFGQLTLDEKLYFCAIDKFHTADGKGRYQATASKEPMMFATIKDDKFLDMSQPQDKMTTKAWDASWLTNQTVLTAHATFASLFSGTFGVTVTPCLYDSTRVCVNLPICEPNKTAMALVFALKAAYSLYQFSKLPNPLQLLYRYEPRGTFPPNNTGQAFEYMLSGMSTVVFRPALTNCSGEVWWDVLDFDGNILLTVEYNEFKHLHWRTMANHKGMLFFRDNDGIVQIRASGLGLSQPLVVHKGQKLVGSVNPNMRTTKIEFYDENNQVLMTEEKLKPVNDMAFCDPSLPNPNVIPYKREIWFADGQSPYLLATLQPHENHTSLAVLPDKTIRNNWKILMLAHAWKTAHSDHKLFRFAPMICSKTYGYRV